METEFDSFPMARRDLLKTVGLGVALGALGVGTMSRSVGATSHVTETIYLSHSTSEGGSNVTKLFSVDLTGSPGNAVLAEVTTIGAPFQNVDAIAASPDGATVMFIDRNTKHLGAYDVGADTFGDLGQVSGLPGITVLAAFGLDGVLYAASNTTNTLYTVDYSVTPPVATEVGLVTGATVNGADIVFDSTGTLFLHSNADDTLYTVDYENPDGNGNIAATAVGTDAGSSLTGLAVRAAGQGDLVGSSRADDAIIVLDKTDGARSATYPMVLNGTAYSYTNGDMATGVIIDETCTECTSDGLLAKYEFACIEEVDSSAEDEEPEYVCVDHDFVLETGDESLVSYTPGSYESKAGQDFEPVSATFGTDLCSVWAVVKAGQAFSVTELEAADGHVTAEYIAPHAISFMAFFCTEAAAEAFVESFPSKEKGPNR